MSARKPQPVYVVGLWGVNPNVGFFDLGSKEQIYDLIRDPLSPSVLLCPPLPSSVKSVNVLVREPAELAIVPEFYHSAFTVALFGDDNDGFSFWLVAVSVEQ